MKQLMIPFVCLASFTAVAAAYGAAPQYHLAHEVPLAGDDGWDYLSFDGSGNRLFVAHGTRVQAMDAGKLSPAGEIADTPGVHGIAFATDLGRGYISVGRSGSVV